MDTRAVGEARVEAGPEVVSAVVETRDLTVCCNEAPCPPDKPLVLIKCADRHAANIGDVVTFLLKYSNLGGRPITEVAVTDSLTGRLEYVPGSAKANRDAVFTTQLNEAGSLILHWEVSGPLPPGESGVVTTMFGYSWGKPAFKLDPAKEVRVMGARNFGSHLKDNDN